MVISSEDQHSYPGARWWKFDFHTHTPESTDYGKGPDQASLRKVSPRDWLLEYMRASLDCVVVTDHNSGAWIDRLSAALQDLDGEQPLGYRKLHIFPGVELSVNGGFHLLAIFDPDKTTSDIDTLIGAVSYHGTKGDSDGATQKSAIEVVQEVLKLGGIPIPAHTDRSKGLLRISPEDSKKTAIDPNTVVQLLDCPDVLAMEVINVDSVKPEIYEQRRLSWSEVLGSDSHHPVDHSHATYPGSHFTWVKMATPSIQGLRLALLDGRGFSIRRSDSIDFFEPPALPKHYIESIEVSEARYMGNGQPLKAHFSP